MFEDELRQMLLQLCASTGAADAFIARSGKTPEAPEAPEGGLITVPLGGGAHLGLRDAVGGAEAVATALEHTARALRACARRWNEELPALGGEPGLPMRARILHRIEAFLGALSDTNSALNALVTVRGKLLTSATPPTELQRERIDFLLRRVDVEVARKVGETSHAELIGEDFFALSFWFGACLVVFFDGPFSVDFIRHRARAVTRELSTLLPDLDEPPRDPARVAPIPE